MKRKSDRIAKAGKVVKVTEFSGWEKIGTVLLKNFNATFQDKVVALDMDGTVINTKSGKTFATSKDDWVLFNTQVKEVLTNYYKQSYLIAILSNQNGIEKGKAKASDILHKITQIQLALDIPFIFLCAISDDENRKPGTGMWKILNSYFKKEASIKDSYYIGDAAGRAFNSTTGKKDFTDTDLKFAKNVGLIFQTPEEFFITGAKVEEKKEESKETIKAGTILDSIPTDGHVFSDPSKKVISDAQEIVMFVGSPGSGKSTFWQNYMPNYERINRDTLKTMEKCAKVLKEKLALKKSCVIDNTNKDPDSRKIFTSIANEYKVPIRCFVFEMDKKLSSHLDAQRKFNTNRAHLSKHVGRMPINIFYSQYKTPTLAEGFSEILTVKFIAKFENEKDKAQFYQLT